VRVVRVIVGMMIMVILHLSMAILEIFKRLGCGTPDDVLVAHVRSGVPRWVSEIRGCRSN
jgi:hypothetical protein